MCDFGSTSSTPAFGGGLVLEVPPFPPIAKVVRDAVGACATVAHFTADEVADARLAADEAFSAMVLLGAGTVVLTVDIDEHAVRAAMRAPAPERASWDVDALRMTRLVLDTLCTEPAYGVDGGTAFVDLRLQSVRSSVPDPTT